MSKSQIIYKAKKQEAPAKEKTDTKDFYVKKKTAEDKKEQKEKKNVAVVQIQWPWWTKIILFASLAILIYFIFAIFTPLLDNLVLIQWWNKYGGKDFTKDFSIYKYAYYTSFRIYYNILKGTSGSYSNFDDDGQAAFFSGMVSSFSIFDPNQKEEGRFLLPLNMCKTIIPKEMSQKYDYPDNQADWKNKFQEWGYPDKIPSNIADLITSIDADKYQNAEDNFLWQDYGIPANSPLILSFYANTSTGANGEKWYPEALLVALGSDYSGVQAPFGGWWGYAKFGIAEYDYASLITYIYSTESRQGDASSSKSKSCGWGVTGGILQGGATGAMAGGALGPEGAIGGFVIGAIAGGFSSGSKNCGKSS